jgi:hypothetical protein
MRGKFFWCCAFWYVRLGLDPDLIYSKCNQLQSAWGPTMQTKSQRMNLENKGALKRQPNFSNSFMGTRQISYVSYNPNSDSSKKKILSLNAKWIETSFRHISLIPLILVSHTISMFYNRCIQQTIFCYNFFITTRYMKVNLGIQYSMY